MTRPLPEDLMHRLVERFGPAGDPERAGPAAAYMRNHFPFLGIPAPTQRALARAVLAGLPAPAGNDLREVALACWKLDEREYQYFACDWLRTHVAVPGPEFLGTVRTLVTEKSWWDTIDPLATRVVGGLVRRHPELVDEMDGWAAEDDIWLIRTAILHQLHYGTETDRERLFGYCTRQAGHGDFFIRKAIGWALRQYARTEPEAVTRYVDTHRELLSPLSIREATKHLPGSGG